MFCFGDLLTFEKSRINPQLSTKIRFDSFNHTQGTINLYKKFNLIERLGFSIPLLECKFYQIFNWDHEKRKISDLFSLWCLIVVLDVGMEKKLLEWTQPESPAEYKIKVGLKGPLPTSIVWLHLWNIVPALLKPAACIFIAPFSKTISLF